MMMERNTPPCDSVWFFETWRALLFLIHSINWSIMLSGFIDVWRYTKIKIVQILFSRSYSSYQLFPAPLQPASPNRNASVTSRKLIFLVLPSPSSPSVLPYICKHFPTAQSSFYFHHCALAISNKAMSWEIALSAEYDKGLFYVPWPYISCA